MTEQNEKEMAAQAQENSSLQEAPAPKRGMRAAFALAAAAMLALAVGGFAFAARGVAELANGEDGKPQDADAWTELTVTLDSENALQDVGSSVTQKIAVANNVVASEGASTIQEGAYVRVHVALPAAVNDLDGDSGDDIVQIDSAAASPWQRASSYETAIDGIPCRVRVFVYAGVLKSGDTACFEETFTVTELCDVGKDGTTVTYVKDGTSFTCENSIPLYVCSQAVQASAWVPVGEAPLNQAVSVLDAAFGAAVDNYQPESWASTTAGNAEDSTGE